ncbi:MAG: hypothetical protein A3G39_08975 [Deltaproteobacteria bacterium RIFCSPLOWO2_12_FULL_43_16]|nr:MAG: hypothetical protein A2Z89_06840 [Deltaproteobacteria bacterium GWA2_43_19]OGQ10636.1 MAG: hypothetical protein A3D30_10095 [Deltaproteobacteria bacterium RIFCSPHIGHO2_02_FULL_43_33]OGQ61364.1 MAG: hypothetical protein A3G39_08975 [Deltaproteobacteria bacterium RIFCSPLOWO2_12_FULL_43_16]HBR18371.1 hypothetical protein [Deltaproteobacteria bacterium]
MRSYDALYIYLLYRQTLLCQNNFLRLQETTPALGYRIKDKDKIKEQMDNEEMIRKLSSEIFFYYRG